MSAILIRPPGFNALGTDAQPDPPGRQPTQPTHRQGGAVVPSPPANMADNPSGHAKTPHPSVAVRMSWARLLERVFDIDIEHCPHCGGPLTIIAIRKMVEVL